MEIGIDKFRRNFLWHASGRAPQRGGHPESIPGGQGGYGGV
ncbi:hypothetical protein [Mesorhizobium sp. NZP2077]|nr:hypothetical protein [Mesorhizobium sp. NZP2077]